MPHKHRAKFRTPAPAAEPAADARSYDGPLRVRSGADRDITHEVVQAAIRRFEREGGKIQQLSVRPHP